MRPAAGFVAVGVLVAAQATADSGVDATASAALETVIVHAQRIRMEIESQQALTPGAVTVVDGASLAERSVNNLADLLRYVPGVWSESISGGDEVFFSSRGSNLDATNYDGNGIKMLQDGLPVTTADGNNHNRTFDPLSARYAVIAHGANALTYGASTLGGAIDLVSPTARNSAPLTWSMDAGSHGLLSSRLTAGTVRDSFDGLATVETRSWDGYREHSSQDRYGIYANAGWQHSDRADTRVYATYVDNQERLPGALTQEEGANDPEQASGAALSGNFQKNVDTARIAAKTTWQLNERSRLEAGLSYEEQSLFHPIVDVRLDFDGPGPAPPVQVFSLLVDTDHRDAGAMLRYGLQAGDHDLLVGLNYGNGSVKGGNYRNEGGRPNGLAEHVDNSADSLEVFLVDRWRLAQDWTVVYGAQYVDASRDVRTSDAETGSVRNPNADYSSVNPRLGVIRAVSERTDVFASVSRLYEAPTTYQLEDDVRGSEATLDAMHGTVYEIGVRSNIEPGEGVRWHWDVSAYYAQVRDEILSVDDPDAPGTSLSTNIDRTTHAGLEALVAASLTLPGDGSHRIEPLLSLTLNDFTFDGDAAYGDNDLPAAPTYVARGEVLYRNAVGFYAGPTLDVVGQRYVDFANSYQVDGYALVGLRAGFQRKGWEVFGEVRNLLDEQYIATVGVLDRADDDARVLYPGAPVSAFAGVRVQF